MIRLIFQAFGILTHEVRSIIAFLNSDPFDVFANEEESEADSEGEAA